MCIYIITQQMAGATEDFIQLHGMLALRENFTQVSLWKTGVGREKKMEKKYKKLNTKEKSRCIRGK